MATAYKATIEKLSVWRMLAYGFFFTIGAGVAVGFVLLGFTILGFLFGGIASYEIPQIQGDR